MENLKLTSAEDQDCNDFLNVARELGKLLVTIEIKREEMPSSMFRLFNGIYDALFDTRAMYGIFLACQAVPNFQNCFKIDYKRYLKTEYWKRTADALKKKHGHCQLCRSISKLQVHHNNYEHFFCETEKDLVVLCDKCHSKFHDKPSKDSK